MSIADLAPPIEEAIEGGHAAKCLDLIDGLHSSVVGELERYSLSLRAMARQTGLSFSAVSKFVNGERYTLNAATLIRIAEWADGGRS